MHHLPGELDHALHEKDRAKMKKQRLSVREHKKYECRKPGHKTRRHVSADVTVCNGKNVHGLSEKVINIFQIVRFHYSSCMICFELLLSFPMERMAQIHLSTWPCQDSW